ncbi:XdhC and CoxI family protein [Pirellulimonas nuda]|uniref:XdhC and CoxI family protein n=1 Tax=Pirellulimonas nuda TaxID=2528009 RepID=A0A518DH00_9BACT|nr:xanthine dehydrogenase accessory protein XdhC [Pirellulimonas nuda]QDU90751.1 XdhC and CoxI family protein [Pirellulimonas nuda]
MSQPTFIDRYAELAASGSPFVAVTVVDVIGSTPQNAGSRMIVTRAGLDQGTVGGGKIEARAIEEARAMLHSGERTRFFDWSLKADIGMTCGGRVRVYMESCNVATWRIVIFGAGHVTQALAPVLVALPCTVTCVDPRQEWLDRLPLSVRTICTDNPPTEVARLPEDASILCLTKGHASDLPVLLEIFQSGRSFPLVGVIGSAAKRAVLRKELLQAGVAEERIDFQCPVGLPIGSNHPGEIAVSIAAQLLQTRDVLDAEPRNSRERPEEEPPMDADARG